LRIVYLVNSRWPEIRGAERLLLAFMEHGRAQGHDVSVLAPGASAIHRACEERGLASTEAYFGASRRSVRSLKTTLRALRPDIVHGMSIFPVALVRRFHVLPQDAPIGYFAYVSTDPTSSLPVASPHFRGMLKAVRNTISRSEAPRLDAIFSASEEISRRLGQVGIRGRIIAIPGVVDIEALRRQAEAVVAIPDGSPRIGYAAFLEKLKGIDDLVAAFALVAEEHPDAALLIAGDGPEKENLRHLAEQLGVGDRVHLLGFIDPAAPLLKALDVFVSPSHSEAFSLSIVEAMAIGVPCVATDVGGTSEVVRDGQTGLLVPPRDPKAMARAIERVLHDREFAEHIAEAGQALVAAGRYSLQASLETVFAEYERALSRGAGQAT
jgi:glycosyltransferase involved in cell wall biosynthesis